MTGEVAYTVYGDLRRRPLVVALGGITADRHIAAHCDDPRPGWWQDVVGPGLAIDTDRFSVLGVDYLGGAGETTDPTTVDQARAVVGVLDRLGVDRAAAVVGASYGGMVALALAAHFPARLERVAVLGAAHESHPMATALRSVQRRIVRLGVEAGREAEALAIARALAMTTYRSAEEFAERFAGAGEPGPDGIRFPIDGYLDRHGARFAERFDAGRFLRLSESIDLHRVDPARIRVPTWLFAVEGDRLVPVEQIRELHRRLAGPSDLVVIRSRYGHDAFLKEIHAVSAFLADALGARPANSLEVRPRTGDAA